MRLMIAVLTKSWNVSLTTQIFRHDGLWLVCKANTFNTSRFAFQILSFTPLLIWHWTWYEKGCQLGLITFYLFKFINYLVWFVIKEFIHAITFLYITSQFKNNHDSLPTIEYRLNRKSWGIMYRNIRKLYFPRWKVQHYPKLTKYLPTWL